MIESRDEAARRRKSQEHDLATAHSVHVSHSATRQSLRFGFLFFLANISISDDYGQPFEVIGSEQNGERFP